MHTNAELELIDRCQARTASKSAAPRAKANKKFHHSLMLVMHRRSRATLKEFEPPCPLSSPIIEHQVIVQGSHTCSTALHAPCCLDLFKALSGRKSTCQQCLQSPLRTAAQCLPSAWLRPTQRHPGVADQMPHECGPESRSHCLE